MNVLQTQLWCITDSYYALYAAVLITPAAGLCDQEFTVLFMSSQFCRCCGGRYEEYLQKNWLSLMENKEPGSSRGAVPHQMSGYVSYRKGISTPEHRQRFLTNHPTLRTLVEPYLKRYSIESAPPRSHPEGVRTVRK